MPEAFTYYDMKRMIAAQVPEGQYVLELHPQYGQTIGTTPESSSLKGKAKMAARKNNPQDFIPQPEITYPNLELLPARIRDGQDSFPLCGQEVESYGKAIGIPIRLQDGRTLWLRVFCSLHGHVLPMPLTEYQEILSQWYLHARTPPYIQLAIVGSSHCIVVTDREKLTTITIVAPLFGSSTWWNREKVGYCPIRDAIQFDNTLRVGGANYLCKSKQNTFTDLIRTPRYFNGIGTSHATEILHLARIHPDQSTRSIFENQPVKVAFIQAMRSFFNQATSSEYLQRVPARSTTYSALDFATSVTRYINEQFTKVYRKSRV